MTLLTGRGEADSKKSLSSKRKKLMNISRVRNMPSKVHIRSFTQPDRHLYALAQTKIIS